MGQHIPHLGRHQHGGLGVAWPQCVGLASGAQGGHDDGALIHVRGGLLCLAVHDEICSAHADGHEGRIESKALFGPFGCGTRDGARHARFKLEPHLGFRHPRRVVLVFFDHEAARRANADQRIVDEANVDMPAHGGFNPVAGLDRSATVGGVTGAAGGDNGGRPQSQCHGAYRLACFQRQAGCCRAPAHQGSNHRKRDNETSYHANYLN